MSWIPNLLMSTRPPELLLMQVGQASVFGNDRRGRTGFPIYPATAGCLGMTRGGSDLWTFPTEKKQISSKMKVI